jgi:dinuclear metal center YbgI/SA1388 family protein
MVTLHQLQAYTDNLLQVDQFQDYCPNGLQVQGKDTVNKIVTGVTACQALIDAALEAQADAVLVHHGYFWKGEDLCIIGMKRQRVRKLLQADVSLLAYHLPLDAHPTLGNNAQLAERLDLQINNTFGEGRGPDIGLHGQLSHPMTADALCQHIEQCLGRTPLHIGSADSDASEIRSIAWCSGAAQGYIEAAAALGVDAYLSGEISEQTVHVARELGIHFFSAGHHATERYGVQALGNHLAQHFGLEHHFIDIDNPV